MAAYDAIASVYDALVADTAWDEHAHTLLDQYVPDADPVLEIACGTGTVLEPLAAEDVSVYGIDISADMLDRAQAKLPEGEFTEADMTDFELEKQFPAVLCVGDSINHVDTWREWEDAISQAADHVASNGVYLIDVNVPWKLEQLADSPPHINRSGGGVEIMDVRKEGENRYAWHTTVFNHEEDDLFKRHHTVIHESAYPVPRIKETLYKYFATVDVYRVENGELEQVDTDTVSAPVKADRVFFACTKHT